MPEPKSIPAGFSVVADTREQLVYDFTGLWSGPAGRSPLIEVSVIRQCLPLADYSIVDHPGFVVERKSKADLYHSIARARENFEDRLRRMNGERDCPWMVVEAEWLELLTDPPKHTDYPPKSLCRTILAWMVRYDRVHWLFAPSREHAMHFTYRLMERYVKENESLDHALAVSAAAIVAAQHANTPIGEVAGAAVALVSATAPVPADPAKAH